MNEVVKIAIAAMKQKLPDKYSAEQTSDTLRKALIEANGGSTVFDIKSLRRHPELYDIIEELIPYITKEGLEGNEFFMNYVDYRNEKLGDDTEFWTEDNSLFLVADAAHGTQAIRRQRLNVGTKVTFVKTLKVIKIYEELNRLLAGRVDFNTFVNRIAKSMTNKLYDDIYTVLDSISASTAGLTSDYVKTGSFAEDTLVTLIDHVEAATGARATIVGTRSALRNVTSAVTSYSAKEDMYNTGFYGKFNGTPMIVAPQRHIIGTDSFKLSTSKLHILASDDKFLKVIDSGEGLLIDKDPTTNQDLTKEYLYGQAYGVGTIVNAKIGIYNIS
jgi:hypothetical protein